MGRSRSQRIKSSLAQAPKNASGNFQGVTEESNGTGNGLGAYLTASYTEGWTSTGLPSMVHFLTGELHGTAACASLRVEVLAGTPERDRFVSVSDDGLDSK